MKNAQPPRHRHYGTHAIIICLGLYMLTLPMKFLGAAHAPIVGTLSCGVLVAVIAAFRHLRGPLCEQCIAAMPLDPQTRATRTKPLLRTAHLLLDGGPRRVAFAAPWIGLYVTAGWIPLFLRMPPGTQLAASELLALYTMVMTAATRTHSSYGPWCPYCRRGGDDVREETSPPAVPQPA